MPSDRPSYRLKANPFESWLQLQFELQLTAFDNDPSALGSENRAEFLIWNAFAAEDELHEAMQEVGWKPWATSRHLNREAFLDEIVDAMHFVGNMILTCALKFPELDGKLTDDYTDIRGLADELWQRYRAKVQKNIDRQREGYTGLDKCPQCGRDLQKVDREAEVPIICPEHGKVR